MQEYKRLISISEGDHHPIYCKKICEKISQSTTLIELVNKYDFSLDKKLQIYKYWPLEKSKDLQEAFRKISNLYDLKVISEVIVQLSTSVEPVYKYKLCFKDVKNICDFSGSNEFFEISDFQVVEYIRKNSCPDEMIYSWTKTSNLDMIKHLIKYCHDLDDRKIMSNITSPEVMKYLINKGFYTFDALSLYISKPLLSQSIVKSGIEPNDEHFRMAKKIDGNKEGIKYSALI